jgi:hypothetical protein
LEEIVLNCIELIGKWIHLKMFILLECVALVYLILEGEKGSKLTEKLLTTIRLPHYEEANHDKLEVFISFPGIIQILCIANKMEVFVG